MEGNVRLSLGRPLKVVLLSGAAAIALVAAYVGYYWSAETNTREMLLIDQFPDYRRQFQETACKLRIVQAGVKQPKALADWLDNERYILSQSASFALKRIANSPVDEGARPYAELFLLSSMRLGAISLSVRGMKEGDRADSALSAKIEKTILGLGAALPGEQGLGEYSCSELLHQ
jgi:hypothetical protein